MLDEATACAWMSTQLPARGDTVLQRRVFLARFAEVGLTAGRIQLLHGGIHPCYRPSLFATSEMILVSSKCVNTSPVVDEYQRLCETVRTQYPFPLAMLTDHYTRLITGDRVVINYRLYFI